MKGGKTSNDQEPDGRIPAWRRTKRERYESCDYGEKYDLGYASGLNDLNTLVERSWISRHIDGKTVLDAGAGTGRFIPCLWAEGRKVVALDSSQAMLAALGEKYPSVPCILSDIYALPVAEKSFDAVVCMHVLFHLPDWDLVLSGLVRAIRPGGGIFFEMRSGEHARLAEKFLYLFGLRKYRDRPKDPAAATVYVSRARVREAMEKAGLEPVRTLSYDLGHSYYLAPLSGFLESLFSRFPLFKSVFAFLELHLGSIMPPSLSYRSLYFGRKR